MILLSFSLSEKKSHSRCLFFSSALSLSRRGKRAFTLVELIVVIGIIAILIGLTAPLVPSLFKADQMDQSVGTLSGLMEVARETALSGNTFVWVAFTDPPPSSPQTGTWVAVFQSQDGTESPINASVTPFWATTGITVPGPNLILVSKLQNLPGARIVLPSALPATVTGLPNVPTGATTLFQSQWTVTALKFTQGVTPSTQFTKAVEFTPDGEAHVQTWATNIQFGMLPSTGANTKNAVLLNLTRLTGKLTVFRP